MRKAAVQAIFLFLSVLSYSQDLADVKKKYLEGISYFAGYNLKGAESDFNFIINMKLPKGSLFDPYKARSYYFEGDIAFIRQDYASAVDCYKAVADFYYNDDIYSKDLYKLGRTLILSGRVNEGVSILEDYIHRYRDTDSLADHGYYWLARGFALNNDFFRAIETLQFVLTNYPSSDLTFEIRSTLPLLQEKMEMGNMAGPAGEENMTNAASLLKKGERLKNEKSLLEKMDRLLLIKQRLIEIKAEKIEILSRLKEKNGVE